MQLTTTYIFGMAVCLASCVEVLAVPEPAHAIEKRRTTIRTINNDPPATTKTKTKTKTSKTKTATDCPGVTFTGTDSSASCCVGATPISLASGVTSTSVPLSCATVIALKTDNYSALQATASKSIAASGTSLTTTVAGVAAPTKNAAAAFNKDRSLEGLAAIMAGVAILL